jgi:hypothetical protein
MADGGGKGGPTAREEPTTRITRERGCRSDQDQSQSGTMKVGEGIDHAWVFLAINEISQ